MGRKLRIGTIIALLAMALPGSALASSPASGSCAGGSIPGGTYGDFTVTGICNVAFGSVLNITGDLTIADGASLDDHGAEMWLHAQVHVGGDIHVGKGAVLGLGWNSPQGEGSLGPDTVGGDIVANQPLAMQIGQVTIGGNVISNGGGIVSLSAADSRNFPIEDNIVHGNVSVQGWHGGWFGIIRNTVDGNVIVARVVSLSNRETGPGPDNDSTEIMGSDLSAFGGPVIPQTIGGNLICHDNVPAAQVNPFDGGANNIVLGKALGECASLTQ